VAQTIVGLELPDIQDALGKDVPRFRARQIYDAVYRQKVSDLIEISTLPAGFRKDLATHHEVGLPETAASFQSTDGTVRYLLKLADGRMCMAKGVQIEAGKVFTIEDKELVGCSH